MRLAISHIAWDPAEDTAAYELLGELGIRALEVAPPRWWPGLLAGVPEAECAPLETARREGFEIVAFQALLFGRADLLVFSDARTRAKSVDYLARIAEVAGRVGARSMVFGSPRNRFVPPEFTPEEAWEVAVDFFQALGAAAAAHGASFCIEPNPGAYGCNFLTHTQDAARMVRAVGSPGIRLQIDGGELALNEEVLDQAIGENGDIIGHVHISQPMLDSFSDPWTGHTRVAGALRSAGYHGVVSVEMKRQPGGLAAVREAIGFAKHTYLC